MATVKVETNEHRFAHYGLYRTGLGGDERVVIRRKVGEKTDFQHSKSQKVKRQRERLSIASRHWTSLTPSQKDYWRRQIGFVKREGSPSQEVLLKGRELFIARDIYSLIGLGRRLPTPYEVCIVLCDEEHTPLYGNLWVRYYEEEEWKTCPGQQIGFGQWLFSTVPQGKEFYRVEGLALGYYDPKLPEHQFMLEETLRTYHNHVLLTGMELVILEPWQTSQEQPPPGLVILEPWQVTYTQPEWERVIKETWSG